MNAQTDIAELQVTRMAATRKVKTAKRKKDGTISSSTAEAGKSTLELLKAEVDAGYSHPVPRPTKADHRAASDAYQSADASAQRLGEDNDTLKWLQENKSEVERLIAERSVWRKALCSAMGRLPGAFSAEFCARQIRRLNDAITRTRNALRLRNIH